MPEKAAPIEKSLVSLKFICSLSGLTIESKKRKLRDKIRARILYVFNIMWLHTDVLGGMYGLVDCVKQGRDFTELTYSAPCIMYSLLSHFKSHFFLIYEDEINELIDELKEIEIKLNTGENDNEDRIWREKTNFLNAVLKISNILNVILLISFAIGPLVLMMIKYLKTNEVEFLLPFLIMYPFDHRDIQIWPFVFLHQIWSECVVVLNMCSCDYLFWICCMYIRINFLIVQSRLENIVDLDNNSLEQIQRNLAEVIVWHQRFIRSVDKLEALYTRSTLSTFVSSSILICLTGFNVMAIEDAAVNFLIFLFANLMQIFVLCSFGDMMMAASTDVADAVYNSQWYVSNAIAKKLLAVQIRAQKPCRLTASGFAEVNLRAFMKILSSAWSYFALLNTMYGAPDST